MKSKNLCILLFGLYNIFKEEATMKFTWEDFEDFWKILWENIYKFFSHFCFDTPLDPEEPCTND